MFVILTISMTNVDLNLTNYVRYLLCYRILQNSESKRVLTCKISGFQGHLLLGSAYFQKFICDKIRAYFWGSLTFRNLL